MVIVNKTYTLFVEFGIFDGVRNSYLKHGARSSYMNLVDYFDPLKRYIKYGGKKLGDKP